MPPSNVEGGLFNWAAFKNPAFTCCGRGNHLYRAGTLKLTINFLVIAYNATLLGLFVPLIYLDLSAQASGLSPNFTFYLIAIANCASLFGRLSSGILADKYGPLNTLIPFTLIGGIMSFVWPFVTSHVAPLVIVTIVYGCAIGAFVSLIPSTPARLGGMDDAGRRYVHNIALCSLKVMLKNLIQDWYGNDSHGRNISENLKSWLPLTFSLLWILCSRYLAQREDPPSRVQYVQNLADSKLWVCTVVV